ncbi:phage tail assembly chaperone G [Fictibacillus fluitans]|uniref:Phage protein n=1 Tax=Fictibacillus fluitans TaxID=3058422 RepID=A0ABT8HXX4_9BACL|nr:hypothetical protein [Fictibacillus sp. NE201]MDN4525320.1 hypothetical protein [Fictibacillus sp. NE201]
MANLKRNMIELVTDVKEGEVITEKFLTPVFIPFSVVYEALDLEQELSENANEKELLEKYMYFVANKIYKGQFTKEQLYSGLHAPSAYQVLQDQILFVSQGYQTEETKKFLEKKN